MAKRKPKVQVNKGVRKSMPELIALGTSLANNLICRHGAKQAATIGRMVAEKTLSAYKAQKGEL